MRWRSLLPLPLAALALGRWLAPPELAPPLPVFSDPACDYAAARKAYLRAFAYARENPRAARLLLLDAERERVLCSGDTAALAARIARLRAALP